MKHLTQEVAVVQKLYEKAQHELRQAEDKARRANEEERVAQARSDALRSALDAVTAAQLPPAESEIAKLTYIGAGKPQ